ncbi:MAG: hypothetical protein WBA97_22360 [Actinophytocola sp.]|uniref:hypothetical protein n=1 Tax=Actinophytocola sp. TaxID=1872138 RepID=UPI003C72E99E
MTAQVVNTGLDGFVAALHLLGADPHVQSDVVIYTVTPISGALAGRAVRTGVGVEEVAPWPAAPPHWLHFPADVTFGATNSRNSSLPGWRAHSRDIGTWGVAQVPAAAWLAHVRGVLGGAM